MRADWLVPVLTLGPGTVSVIGIVAVAAAVLLDLPWMHAFIAGAALASTDAVVLRDVIRDQRVPGAVRRTLSIEAGTNDVIVLPPVLVLSAVAARAAGTGLEWAWFAVQLFLIGPGIGALVGAGGAWAMGRVDARAPIRREYQALYGVGLVLAAFALGEWLGADGFLAAFAAGAAVALANVDLCDCFLDFGEIVAEMAMMLTFLLFGIVLSPMLGGIVTPDSLAFAGLVLLVARPVTLFTVLSIRRRHLSRAARGFIAWFGPRGLNSLLLALLAVGAGVPGGERLFAVVGIVVVASVVLHGVSATPMASWYGRVVARSTHDEERESTATGLLRTHLDDAPRVSVEGVAQALDGDDPPIVVDVRSRSSYASATTQIPGSVRVRPDDVEAWARQQPKDRLIVLYCT
jgi:NhaP-type Na+/H+ or K+/H+ antiporter